MRIMLTMEARMDSAYQSNYHPAVQGRIWSALEGTEFINRHDTNDPPGFSYSNPFPPQDMEEGDERKLIIASVNEDMLAHIAADLLDNREFNIKQMPFNITDISDFTVDVGEPGTEGIIENGTGMLIRIPHWDLEKYGLTHPKGDSAETPVYWRPKHGMEIFRNEVEKNIDYKHSIFMPDHLPRPEKMEYDLFEEYDLIKNYAVPIRVNEDYVQEFILSKWRFKYRIQDEHHRRHLNLALNLGLGEKNGMGLGFINLREKTPLREQL